MFVCLFGIFSTVSRVVYGCKPMLLDYLCVCVSMPGGVYMSLSQSPEQERGRKVEGEELHVKLKMNFQYNQVRFKSVFSTLM